MFLRSLGHIASAMLLTQAMASKGNSMNIFNLTQPLIWWITLYISWINKWPNYVNVIYETPLAFFSDFIWEYGAFIFFQFAQARDWLIKNSTDCNPRHKSAASVAENVPALTPCHTRDPFHFYYYTCWVNMVFSNCSCMIWPMIIKFMKL